MAMAMTIEKLKKVIDMAKLGATEGERANAKRIAEKACAELGIKYEDAVIGKFGNKNNEDNPFVWYDDYVDVTGFYKKSSDNVGQKMNDLYEEILRHQRQQQQQQQTRNDFFYGHWQQQQDDRAKKRNSSYTDKFGEKWSGVEVANLSKERRYKLFGHDPMI